MNSSSNAGPVTGVTDVTDSDIGAGTPRLHAVSRPAAGSTRAAAPAQPHRRHGRHGRGQEYGTGQRVGRAGSGPPSAAPAGEPAATKSHSLYFDFPL